MLKNLVLLLILITTSACLPLLEPAKPVEKGNNDDVPVMPVLGVKVRVAYIHLKSLTYEEISHPAVKQQIYELWQKYDAVYMYIEAGTGLRYFDFGTVKLEYNLPVRPWTTGDYHTTKKWNYLVSQEPVLEDNHAHDYSFTEHGFSNRFVRTPFAMHYRMRADWMVRFNILGANLDSTNFNNEVQAVKEIMDQMPTTFWNTPGIIAFGNFTKNCQNELNGLIIQNDDGTCAEESVVISDYLKPKVSETNVITSQETEFDLLTNSPMIEVILDL